MRARNWMMGGVALLALATMVVSCGGTGGGGGSKGGTDQQFILNSNNSGRLNLNVSPGEVDANKSDRIGLVATLSDSLGHGISGVTITFSSDIDDITFLPADGIAVTDANGRADVIAIAGSIPTGTGAIVGTGAIFAKTPAGFGLRAQVPITLLDVGFIDGDVLSVIPASLSLVEPGIGQVLFFNIIGGNPPYLLKNEVSGIGAAVISQHCLPGCTENGGVLCIGSPCQSDTDCNANGSPTPSGVCAGPIRRCLASCAGTNCAGSRCATDSDCNDGSATPANVCKDSGQSIAYIIGADPSAGTHDFIVEDSKGGAVTVEVTVSFVCGNGVARGDEQCDLGDLRQQTCESLGHGSGILSCATDCTFDFTNCTFATPTPGGGGGGGATSTPGGPTSTAATRRRRRFRRDAGRHADARSGRAIEPEPGTAHEWVGRQWQRHAHDGHRGDRHRHQWQPGTGRDVRVLQHQRGDARRRGGQPVWDQCECTVRRHQLPDANRGDRPQPVGCRAHLRHVSGRVGGRTDHPAGRRGCGGRFADVQPTAASSVSSGR